MAPYDIRKCKCMEIYDGDDWFESLWVKIKAKANKTDIILGISYQPPDQDEEVVQTFYRLLVQVRRSLSPVLVGNFRFLDIRCIYDTADREQSQRFLGLVGDNFLTLMVKEPTRESKILDLLFVNREGLVGI